ncbi:MAG: NAD(P)H-dependent oxidoreductase [Planctomycetota bacterium]|nr:NAD(P)H-dependent oxidoreductase [Planctomycetota bacterium]
METCRIMVIYDSDKGATRTVAEHVAKGAAKIRHINVEMRFCEDVELKEMLKADAFAFGTPNHLGTMSARMKMFFRKLQPLWEQGSLRGKPASVFTASGKFHGGAETSMLSLMFPVFAHGMLLVGLPTFPRSYVLDGCFLGVKAFVDRSKDDGPDEPSLNAARALGERLARTVLALKAGRMCVKEQIVDEKSVKPTVPPLDTDDQKELDRLMADGDVDAWQCKNCGYVHNGDVPPEICPVCNLEQASFTAYDVDAWECRGCGFVVYSQRPSEPCPVCGEDSKAFNPYKG